jgi:hypothetical protein
VSALSSELGPLSRKRVCPPPVLGERVTLAGEEGLGESPNFDEGTYTVIRTL